MAILMDVKEIRTYPVSVHVCVCVCVFCSYQNGKYQSWFKQQGQERSSA